MEKMIMKTVKIVSLAIVMLVVSAGSGSAEPVSILFKGSTNWYKYNQTVLVERITQDGHVVDQSRIDFKAGTTDRTTTFEINTSAYPIQLRVGICNKDLSGSAGKMHQDSAVTADWTGVTDRCKAKLITPYIIYDDNNPLNAGNPLTIRIKGTALIKEAGTPVNNKFYSKSS